MFLFFSPYPMTLPCLWQCILPVSDSYCCYPPSPPNRHHDVAVIASSVRRFFLPLPSCWLLNPNESCIRSLLKSCAKEKEAMNQRERQRTSDIRTEKKKRHAYLSLFFLFLPWISLVKSNFLLVRTWVTHGMVSYRECIYIRERLNVWFFVRVILSLNTFLPLISSIVFSLR